MKQILLLLIVLQCTSSVYSQSLIKGQITDEIGAVPDVNITIKNSKKGTITNTEGNFEIYANTNDTLLVTHIAYQPKEIVLGENKLINITLNDRVSLDEVVVVSQKARRISCGYTCKYEIVTIEYTEEPKLKLYPNPSPNGIFNLNLDRMYRTVEVQVTSITGQIILSKTIQNNNKNIKMDLSQHVAGLYLINTIVDGKRLPTKKAIVR